jgi:hypothetical protein
MGKNLRKMTVIQANSDSNRLHFAAIQPALSHCVVQVPFSTFNMVQQKIGGVASIHAGAVPPTKFHQACGESFFLGISLEAAVEALRSDNERKYIENAQLQDKNEQLKALVAELQIAAREAAADAAAGRF